MYQQVNEVCSYSLITTTQNVLARSGALIGIFVSSGSGTITVYDSAATTTDFKVVDAFSVSPGSFYPLPFVVASGIYIVLSGSMSMTVGYQGN